MAAQQHLVCVLLGKRCGKGAAVQVPQVGQELGRETHDGGEANMNDTDDDLFGIIPSRRYESMKDHTAEKRMTEQQVKDREDARKARLRRMLEENERKRLANIERMKNG
jgi:hypothetical protein